MLVSLSILNIVATIKGIKDGNMVLQSHDIIYITPNNDVIQEVLEDVQPVLSLISTLTLIWATYFNFMQ